MRNWLIRILLLMCATTPLVGQAGQAGEWRRYKNVDGNFSVLMPVEPKENTDPSGSHTINATSNSVTDTVVYASFEPPQSVNEENFKLFRDGVLKGMSFCTVAAEGPPAPAVRGLVGHHYRMNCQIKDVKLIIIGNLYTGKHYGYAVMVMFVPSAASSADPPTTAKFLDSFSVIDPNK